MNKKLLLLIAFFFSFFLSYGQVASSYCFAPVNGTYVPLTGATDVLGLSSTKDDGFSSIFPLDATTPFNFVFGGVNYSQIQVSSNGLMSFKNTDISEPFYGKTATDISDRKPFLAPLWDDLANTNIPRYVVTGTAPNRIFKIEWLGQKWNYNASNSVISFQIWLYETTNVIEYIYKREGPINGSAAATIGIYDATDTYLTLSNSSTTPTASSSTFTTSISSRPANGQIYRFTPPIASSSVGTYTFCIDNSNTLTTASVTSGRYATVNVVKGFNYTFSVGNAFSSQENLIILDDSNNNVSPPITASGNNGASITWTATVSGAIRVLLTGNCSVSGSGGLTLTLNSIGNTQDSQTTFGTNTWVGHVYNWTGTTPPGGTSPAAPATTAPFTNSNYVGYYNVVSESINEGFGGNDVCFPVLSNGENRVNVRTEQFAVRYRMKSTKTGCYFLNVNGDDGIRVYVDGVLVFNQWKEQSNTTYCNNLIYLNGNSDIILDYYENGGGNVLGFSLTPFVPSNNNIAGNTEINVCSGSSSGLLNGSSYSGCGATNTTYHWQVSTDNVNFTDVSGATAEDYTPPTVTTTTVNVIRYYRRMLKAFATNAASCSFNTNVIKVTTSPSRPGTPGAISGSNTPCLGATGEIYSITAVDNAISYNWTLPSGWVITSGMGTNSITVTVGASGNVEVKAVNGCGESYTQSGKNIQTVPTPSTPGTNSGFSPTCTGYTAQWGYSNNATKYFIDVSTDAGFSSMISAYSNLDVGNVLQYAITGLVPNTSYYYRVRASGVCGISPNSGTMTFTTNPVPTIPVATAGSNPGCDFFTVNLNSAANATGYFLDIATDSAFTAFVSGYNNYNIGYQTSNFFASGLPGGTLYYRLRAYNSCAISSYSNTIIYSTTGTVGGVITQEQTICSGNQPASLVLSGNTGAVVRWEKSTNSVFTTGLETIANTSSTLTSATIGNISTTTYFRAVVKSGSCAEVYSVPVVIAVNTAPFISIAKTDETCATTNDGSISPTLSGGLTNVRYIKLTQKYVNADAWQQVAEIEAFEIFTGTNVAQSTNGASATSSSNYSSEYTAPIAIDGNNSGSNNFWHSGTPNLNEWIKVDLQSGKNLDNIRIYNRTDCCSQRGQNMLLELFDSSDNLIYSKTIDLYQSGANIPVNVNVLDVSWLDGATTLNRTGQDSGAYTLNYVDAIGCSLSSPINIGTANIAAPTRGTITPITCSVPVASVILNNLPSAGTWTLMQSGTSTATITGTGISATVSGLAPGTYTFSVSIGGCSASNPVVVKIDSLQETVWNGAWSNGLPNSDKKLIFNANYSQTTDLVACSCEVTLGNVIVRSDKTLTLTNELKVSGGTLTFENNASLVQINEDPTINSGNITYQRETVTAVDKFDYTYWSSPVSAQTLYNASPNTLWDKYMSFDAVTNNWKQENSSKVMERGVGYIIRGPQNHYAPNPIGTYRANFIGVPHNGTIPVSIAATGEASYLLGNPYPSALDADLFLFTNKDVLDGTLYFWTHNTDIAPSGSHYIYDSDDYASYNLTGGVGTGNGIPAASDVNPIPTIPTGEIASGQGFFATSIAPGTVNFTNAMRLIGNVNSQFFRSNSKSKKNASFDKNRLWLNFSNTEGAFKQTLIGYVTGATNEYERTFDGISFDGNTFVDFYSVLEDKNFVIQGRTLPFLQSDQVPLGYKTTIAGTFTITIFQTDGFLTTQNVFLEDKMLGIIHNLKESSYNFTTEKGVFNERFVLRYTDKTLAVGDFESPEETIVVYKEKNELKIKSEIETMKRVTVFDLLGKKVFEETLKDVNEFRTSNITLKNQIVIVKVVLTNGQVVAKKVSY